MARLFIRHEPIDCEVESSVLEEVFFVRKEELTSRGLTIVKYGLHTAYVCFVNNGKCWAARSFKIMGNKQVRVSCVPFNDDPSGRLMLMKDMLLNH